MDLAPMLETSNYFLHVSFIWKYVSSHPHEIRSHHDRVFIFNIRDGGFEKNLSKVNFFFIIEDNNKCNNTNNVNEKKSQEKQQH